MREAEELARLPVFVGAAVTVDAGTVTGAAGYQDARSDMSWARALSREALALGAARGGGRSFLTPALVFAALLYGEFSRGAFFRVGLIVFTCLALAAAASVPGRLRVLVAAPWLGVSAGSITVAVLVSAFVNGHPGASLYALAPVASAVALCDVGMGASDWRERLLLKRVVVDVAVVTALLGVVGVALHIARFAELQTEGWRASANVGYANATAMILLLGLLCACACADASNGARGDRVRCWVISLGLVATQSRGLLVMLGVCWLVLFVLRRSSAHILAQSLAWSLVAFIGLIPSVERSAPQPVPALVAAVIALTLLVTTATGMTPWLRRTITATVGWSAAVTSVVMLNTRVVDSGSDTGRLRMWHEALSHLHVTGVFGAGPSQIDAFSNGHINQLFDHNDALQYVQYYGVLGGLALVVVVCRLGALFWRPRGGDAIDRAHGAATVIALCGAALVDFPLQIPLIPVTAALVVGLTAGNSAVASERHVSREQRLEEVQHGQ